MSIDPDTVAELRLRLEGAVEECQALVRENERLHAALADIERIARNHYLSERERLDRILGLLGREP